MKRKAAVFRVSGRYCTCGKWKHRFVGGIGLPTLCIPCARAIAKALKRAGETR